MIAICTCRNCELPQRCRRCGKPAPMPRLLKQAPPAPKPRSVYTPKARAPITTLEQAQHEAIARAMAATDHSIPEAAKLLGIGKMTLYRIILKVPKLDTRPNKSKKEQPLSNQTS